MNHLPTSVLPSVRSLQAMLVLGAIRGFARLDARITRRDDGQATAEYALVLLGAAAVALAVVSWASRTNLIGKLLEMVFGGLLRRAG